MQDPCRLHTMLSQNVHFSLLIRYLLSFAGDIVQKDLYGLGIRGNQSQLIVGLSMVNSPNGFLEASPRPPTVLKHLYYIQKASLLYSKSIRSRGTFVILHRLLPVVRATTSDAYRFRMTDCLEM